MNHLVSIVVATYRRDESLIRALASLAEQTYKNIQIVLVDDNDEPQWNEKVKQIVDTFRISYPDTSLTLITNHPNQGSAEARNIGIDEAKGDYITFLDDDDLYLPQKIENQIKSMLDSAADYGFTDLCLYNENDKLVDKRVRKYIEKTDMTSLLTYHLMHHMTGTDTFMFRREYLNVIGGFDPIDVGDEFYLMHKAIVAGGKFAYLSACDVKAYVHTENSGLSSGIQKIEGENHLFDFKKKYFDQLSLKQIRYIKVRHFAVIAFATLHQRQYGKFLKNVFKAVCISPIISLRILLSR